MTVGGGDSGVRNVLSSLRALLALTSLMTERDDEDEIASLTMGAVPSLGRCRGVGLYVDGRWRGTDQEDHGSREREKVERQLLECCGPEGGPLDIPNQTWAWGYPLTTPGGASGYLVIEAPDDPSDDVQFLVRTLAQQAGVALANARLHTTEQLTAAEALSANLALRRRIDIHERLTQVVAAGEGQPGIAQAIFELTGYPVAVEDRWGSLRAWAGPGRPEAYPRDQPARREQLLRQVQEADHPVRDGGRLLAVASPREDVVGVLALIDPEGTAGEKEEVALEHGATVLAMELARRASLAETELRQRRDLVEELLAGGDEDAMLNQAQLIGYDLGRPHRVVVVTASGDAETLFHAVRRAARDARAGSLLGARAGGVVLCSDRDAPWTQFRATVDASLRDGPCFIGVGGVCERPKDFARSHREAQLAMKMQKVLARGPASMLFDDLGVYQLLAELPDAGAVERFVHRWLGTLMDHDARKGSQLVVTLSGYLECGGRYESAAKLLAVHRSTLKYRLQRIRAVTDYDLSDPDTVFNLQLATRAWRTLEALRGT